MRTKAQPSTRRVGPAERGSDIGCVAGALSVNEYRTGLAAAGFTDITITPTPADRRQAFRDHPSHQTRRLVGTSHEPPAPNTRIDAVNEWKWFRPATGPISPPAKNPATPVVPSPARTASTS